MFVGGVEVVFLLVFGVLGVVDGDVWQCWVEIVVVGGVDDFVVVFFVYCEGQYVFGCLVGKCGGYVVGCGVWWWCVGELQFLQFVIGGGCF